MKMVNTYIKYFEYLLKQKYFMVEWLFTMFCRAFSLPVVINIWDLFLYYGEIVFFKMAIGIFSFIENEIT